MKLIPFDLESALNGAEVITRVGNPVTQLARFDLADPPPVLCGVYNGELRTWRLDGSYMDGSSCLDLFMPSKDIDIWISVFKHKVSGQLYATVALSDGEVSEQKDHMERINNIYLKTIATEINT